MELVKIRFPDSRLSWTVLDDCEPVAIIRDWIIHLEEINQSPNTIQAYARHIARLGSYLKAHSKTFSQISVSDYDRFLQWLPYSVYDSSTQAVDVISIQPATKPLTATLKNQVHLATKSFYRYLSGRNSVFDNTSNSVSSRYQGIDSYKPFLEHINQRRSGRAKDRYLSGNLQDVQKK